MGKVRRYRTKLHLAAKDPQKKDLANPLSETEVPSLTVNLPSDDLFANINIDFNSLKTDLADDVRSVKSSESIKSQSDGKHHLPKKEKLKLRRNLLLRKIDTVNQLKKENEVRKKRKNIAVIGDTNALHDALPSLDALLKAKDKVNVAFKASAQCKVKAVEKARKRKKIDMQGLKTFKQILNNDIYKKNPLNAISRHIANVVEQERKGMKTIKMYK